MVESFRRGYADVEVSLRWVSEDASHLERCWIPGMNLWRDILPEPLSRQVRHWRPGETIRHAFEAGELVPKRSGELVMSLPRNQLATTFGGHPVCLEAGRFAPRGVAAKALMVFPQDVRPMQVLSVSASRVTVDVNHPLAGRALELAMHRHRPQGEDRPQGGPCREVVDAVASGGPGMQALFEAPDSCLDGTPLKRPDSVKDAVFYESPRLVNHLDAEAERQVRALYGSLIPKGAAILDLMAGWDSHLPASLCPCRVMGLGMNEVELDLNPALGDWTLHDLNANPVLPFDDESFHAVVCTASVEYAIHPVALFQEVARVLKAGGPFILTFADRWFPPKVTQPWPRLHPFERMGLVLEYFRAAGGFTGYQTESRRGWPRPRDDAYFPRKKEADSLLAVWGKRASPRQAGKIP